MKNIKIIALFCFLFGSPYSFAQSGDQLSLPIIDVHVHTMSRDFIRLFGMDPNGYEKFKLKCVAEMERFNIYGFVLGATDDVADWRQTAPDRVFSGYMPLKLNPPRERFDAQEIRDLHAKGELHVIGEVCSQYLGKRPDDPYLDEMWKVAEELGIPVGYHMGNGPPDGPANSLTPSYRASVGNPLLFEEVLNRYPNLKLYVMHAGWPMLEEMIYLMQVYPNVYAGIGALEMVPDSPNYVKALVEAGYEDRLMFGSDQMAWPERFEIAIKAVEEMDFLSPEQKRKIFYGNAVRFFGIDEESMQIVN